VKGSIIYQALLTSPIRSSRNIRRVSVLRIYNISPKRNRNTTPPFKRRLFLSVNVRK